MDLNATVNPVVTCTCVVVAMQVEVDLKLEKCNNKKKNKNVYCIKMFADFRCSRQYNLFS